MFLKQQNIYDIRSDIVFWLWGAKGWTISLSGNFGLMCLINIPHWISKWSEQKNSKLQDQ